MYLKHVLLCLLLSTVLISTSYADPSESSYSIGDKALGGTVFYVNAYGTHGLVVTNSDQGQGLRYMTPDYCSDETRFDTDAQIYTDWKMPTHSQLRKMYEQRELIGNFKPVKYWNVYAYTEHKSEYQVIDFKNGANGFLGNGTPWIRCIRSF